MNTLELKELKSEELSNINGGGAGPLWWNAMVRAMFLGRTILVVEEVPEVV